LLVAVSWFSFFESSSSLVWWRGEGGREGRKREREREQGEGKREGTYKAVDLATFPNMTRYCGGYGFDLA
jgi:hypothetical protein